MQVLDPFNQEGTGQPGDPFDASYGSAEAGIAVKYKNASGRVNGFGSQGLQASDITNFAAGNDCSSDWCAMFDNYYQTNNNLKLQQLGLSAPVTIAGTNSGTGDLRPLLPFAVSQHMAILGFTTGSALAYDRNYWR